MDAFENPAAQVFSTTDYFPFETKFEYTSSPFLVCKYTIDFYQAAALAVIPLDRLKTAARKKFEAAKTYNPGLKDTLFQDMLLLEFKEWFKTEFFSWVDTPPCPQCGKPTQACG